MELYETIIKNIGNKYGNKHNVTFGIYLYFGLHFVNILSFDLAYKHIEYIINNNNGNNQLLYDEMKLFESLLNAFINKLLNNNNSISYNKENCLKIFEYQLINMDNINHYILNNKQEMIQKQLELKHKQIKINSDNIKMIKKEQTDENNKNIEIIMNTLKKKYDGLKIIKIFR